MGTGGSGSWLGSSVLLPEYEGINKQLRVGTKAEAQVSPGPGLYQCSIKATDSLGEALGPLGGGALSGLGVSPSDNPELWGGRRGALWDGLCGSKV